MNYMLDMVHHNPGELPFETRFLNPSHLLDYGFNGQVFKHINCIATYAASGFDCFPDGSAERVWLDGFTSSIKNEISAAKVAGLKVFYHIDLMVMPKRLISHFKNDICDSVSGRILWGRPMTKELHRILFDELSVQFPEVDGYIIRVGETYLMDTPFHSGNGPIPKVGPAWTPDYLYEEILSGREPAEDRWTSDQADVYVDLLRFLREELCVRLGKRLFFRTWDIFPDKLHARLDHYLEVTDHIDPHPNLAFSIKHTALDFWRRVKTNECLARGRHPQIIEVQCQREYEGKGAYPNYVMDGVINGFEENRVKAGLRDWIGQPNIIGVFSWSRGGGWYGPYIANELWPDLNAFVLAGFVGDPSRSEEDLFYEYATKRLRLSGQDLARFRELCLLSARGILKGRQCEAFDRLLGESLLPTACWMRDDRLGGHQQLDRVLNALKQRGGIQDALNEKAEAVEIWERIVELANLIDWPEGDQGEFVKVSALYGLRLFRIVQSGWAVMIRGLLRDDPAALTEAVRAYGKAWESFRELSASPHCASLFRGVYFSLPGLPATNGLDATVQQYQLQIDS